MAAPNIPPPSAARPSHAAALLSCVALLTVFAALAWLAARSKSPTYDEPLHVVGAWLHLHTGDFRVNPEDPPLWHYWAALPNGPDALDRSAHRDSYEAVSGDVFMEWKYVVEMLYRTPDVDADAVLARSRAMMLLVGIGLGATVMAFAWRLAGPVCAAAAGVLFCFDPNFLAHAPLVKNDVALTLVTLALTIAVWQAGIRITWLNAIAIALLCGAAVNVKYSGVLLGPIVAILLLGRAVMATPWRCLRWELGTRTRRLIAAGALCVLAVVTTYAITWACYGFRYRPSPDPRVILNTSDLVNQVALNQLYAKHPKIDPTAAELKQWRPDAFLSAVLFMEQHRLLPQAFTAGLVYTYQSTFYHNAFLLGRMSMVGWWYYFPVAFLLKAPLTLWLAMVGAILSGAFFFRRRSSMVDLPGAPAMKLDAWTVLCLTVCPALYLLSAMRTNLNIGLRHIFPVLPFVHLWIALAFIAFWRHRPSVASRAGLLLAAALAVEAFAAFPNFIAFFNVALGGSRGGVHLLSDSNLDWGQDLKLLSDWQHRHRDRRLFLTYFGTALPAAYEIDYARLPGPSTYAPPETLLGGQPGVIAISATHLQGVYLDQSLRDYYAFIQRTCPLIDVLGGSIYLYAYNPPPVPPPPADRR